MAHKRGYTLYISPTELGLKGAPSIDPFPRKMRKPLSPTMEAKVMANSATLEAREEKETHHDVQVRFQTSLEALAPMIEASFSTLSNMSEAWFSGVQGFSELNFPSDLMLITTELSEACEADRTDSVSDKIPDYHGREEEIADALVRIFHLCGKYDLRIGPAFIEKMRYNLERPYKHKKAY